MIAGQPADTGTHVSIFVFRAGPTWKACGDSTVQARMVPSSSGTGTVQVVGYQASLFPNSDCQNPANTYTFYVNGVYAGDASYPGNYRTLYQNLSVGAAALRTANEYFTMPLFYVSGQVIDNFNRPARNGTPVTGEAIGASCRGTATTLDLNWTPMFPHLQPVAALGYYVMKVAITPDCADHQFSFRVYAAGNPASGNVINVYTPPYGGSFLFDLRIP